jgi:acetyl-CoA carboxylase carboxyl transferase subunit beta
MSESKDTSTPPQKRGIQPNIFVRCKKCGRSLFAKRFENEFYRVCEYCEFHHTLTGMKRVEQLVDPSSFEEFNLGLIGLDPLGFVDSKPYPERAEAARKRTGANEAVITGTGFIKGRRVVLCCMDYNFIGGSMGSAVGEKITRAVEHATSNNLPLVIVSASGGARMQESGFSLMQMAKISAALARLNEQGGLFISVLTDPTMGGVTASFGMLGDFNLAEPEAMIGFAGPRVIKDVTKEEVERKKQQAEAHLEHGFIDRIVHRQDLRNEIAALIDYCCDS